MVMEGRKVVKEAEGHLVRCLESLEADIAGTRTLRGSVAVARDRAARDAKRQRPACQKKMNHCLHRVLFLRGWTGRVRFEQD